MFLDSTPLAATANIDSGYVASASSELNDWNALAGALFLETFLDDAQRGQGDGICALCPRCPAAHATISAVQPVRVPRCATTSTCARARSSAPTMHDSPFSHAIISAVTPETSCCASGNAPASRSASAHP
eukprot:scaffold143770_cov30-Tisochrysis_lutea.AAC.2